MDYKDDFVNEELVEFDIEGRKFSYKPVTAGEENDWLNEYIVPSEDNKRMIQDTSKLNKCKVRNLKQVPYTKEDIKGLIQVDKSWDQLNINQRWNVLSKLKPKIFSDIIININRIDNPVKKKS